MLQPVPPPSPGGSGARRSRRCRAARPPPPGRRAGGHCQQRRDGAPVSYPAAAIRRHHRRSPSARRPYHRAGSLSCPSGAGRSLRSLGLRAFGAPAPSRRPGRFASRIISLMRRVPPPGLRRWAAWATVPGAKATQERCGMTRRAEPRPAAAGPLRPCRHRHAGAAHARHRRRRGGDARGRHPDRGRAPSRGPGDRHRAVSQGPGTHRGTPSPGACPTAPETVSKMTFSAARNLDFEGHLQRLRAGGRDHVVLCGVESHVCVMQTAADLSAQGYGVHIAAGRLRLARGRQQGGRAGALRRAGHRLREHRDGALRVAGGRRHAPSSRPSPASSNRCAGCGRRARWRHAWG